MKPDVTAIVTGAAISTVTLLLYAAHRGKAKFDPATGDVTLYHSPIYRAVAVLGAFFAPLGVTFILFFHPPKKEGDVFVILGIYAFFAAIGLPLFWESFRFRVGVASDGLHCRSPWRGNRFFPWSDISEISYGTTNAWFIIKSVSGATFHISILVPGLHEFLDRCEAHLSPNILQAARAGYVQLDRPFPGEGFVNNPTEREFR